MENIQREDYYDSPISIEDAASLLRKKISKNERQYIISTTKLNNKKVDLWKKKVLTPISDQRGMVPSGRVWHSWQLFDEGNGIKKYMEIKKKGLLPDPPEEVIEFWKDFFEKLTVEEMHEYGSGVVASGWQIIQDTMKRWFAQQKWDRLFSKNPEDPLWWERNYHSHTDYLNGKVLPFWNEEKLKDIQQKVLSILGNQVQPSSFQSGFR